MKIGILGGSFDPPHNGHEFLAKKIKKIACLDEVWLVPCFIHPFGKKISPANQRLQMTKLLTSKDVFVSDFEIKKRGVSYSIDTLNGLSKKFPENNFFWAINFSELEHFQKWKNWEEIMKKYGLIIFSRDIRKRVINDLIKKFLNLKKIPKNILVVIGEKKYESISSTKIRCKVKSGVSINELVNKNVISFIIKNNLYK